MISKLKVKVNNILRIEAQKGQGQVQGQGLGQDQTIELNRHKMNPFSNQEKEFHRKKTSEMMLTFI